MVTVKKVLSFVAFLFSILSIYNTIRYGEVISKSANNIATEADLAPLLHETNGQLMLVGYGLSIIAAIFCLFGENPMKKWARIALVFLILTPFTVFLGFVI